MSFAVDSNYKYSQLVGNLIGKYVMWKGRKYQITGITRQDNNEFVIELNAPVGQGMLYSTMRDPLTLDWQEISYEEYIKETPTIPTASKKLNFEVGKYYMYKQELNTRVAVRGVLPTIEGHDALIGEWRNGSWRTMDGMTTENWREITKEEFIGITKLEVGKYYKQASKLICVLAFVKEEEDANSYAAEDPNGLLQFIKCYVDGSSNWVEITKEEFTA